MKTILKLFAFGLFLAFAPAVYAQVAIIAHPSVPEGEVDRRDLLQIYGLNKQNWSNEDKIIVFDFGQGIDVNEKSVFYDNLGRGQAVFFRRWAKKKYSGETNIPTLVKTSDEMIELVSKTPGAIGYVSASSVPDGVKVLATIN